MTHAIGHGSSAEWKDYSVLIVAADRRAGGATAGTLRNGGFAVTEVRSGAEGLAQAARGYSAVVVDVELDDTDAFRFCRELRADESTAGLPVLLMSEPGVSPEHTRAALDAGADACLVYPADPVVLLAMTQALVRARAAEVVTSQVEEAASHASHGVDEPEIAKGLQAEVDAIEHAVASVLDTAVNDRTLVALNAILTSTRAQARLLANAPGEGASGS